MNFGYARCSTNESKQDIDRQVRELKAAGAEKVYLEYEHGDSAVKQVQQSMFELAQEGDTIITLEVSRLARSTKQLCEIIDLVKGKSLCLIIVGSITMDCRKGHGKCESQRQIDWAATSYRRYHPGNLLPALSGLSVRPAQYQRICSGL